MTGCQVWPPSVEISTPANKAPIAGEPLKVANLYFSDRSPQKAAGFLQHLMLAYLEERHAWKTENATAAELFLTTELDQTRSKLDDLQNKLAAYRAQNGVVVLDNENGLGVHRVPRLLSCSSIAGGERSLPCPGSGICDCTLRACRRRGVLQG